MKKLKASILVVNYNNAKYIKENINSLKNQTYKNIEIIYFDDFSSDNSISIIKKYKNIRLIQNKKKGKFGSYNQMNGFLNAFNKSSGDILFLLDSDDYFDKRKVDRVLRKFEKNKKTLAIYDLPIYLKKNSLKKEQNKKKFFKTYWPYIPPQSCIAIRRETFKDLIYKISFNNFPDVWMDFRLGIYLKYIKRNFYVINENLTYYRQVENSASSKFKFSSLNWWRRRLQAHNYIKYFFNKYNIFYQKNFDYYLTKFVNFLI